MPDYQNPRFQKKPYARAGSDRFSGPKQMHKANCSNCGNMCEVPFRPNGKKPVFCANCFVKDDGAPQRSSSFAPRREFTPRPSFNAAPAAPREDRGLQDVKNELKGVNEKLERLISLMTPLPEAPAATVKKPAKKAAKKK